MADRRTIGVYDARADDYRAMVESDRPNPDLAAFLSALPPAARILDLGCGPGHAAAAMAADGHAVEAWDASAEMVALAARAPGVSARQRRFEDLDAAAAFDGIWANFSLLHVPRKELPGIMERIARALVPGGILSIGMKTGSGEGRDRLGRFYAYWASSEIEELLERCGMTVLRRRAGEDSGLDGTVSPWVVMLARKV